MIRNVWGSQTDKGRGASHTFARQKTPSQTLAENGGSTLGFPPTNWPLIRFSKISQFRCPSRWKVSHLFVGYVDNYTHAEDIRAPWPSPAAPRLDPVNMILSRFLLYYAFGSAYTVYLHFALGCNVHVAFPMIPVRTNDRKRFAVVLG